MEKAEFINHATKLAASYRSSQDVSEQLAHLRLVAFVGPTGVGKTALIKKVDLPYVLSDVTRSARADEKNSREYYFRTDYANILDDIKNGKYVQFIINSNQEFYGTLASSYPKGGVCTMAIIARALDQFRSLGFADILPIYILPPSYVEWMRRIGSVRGEDLQARLGEARESLPLALDDPKYHFVLNDSIDDAAKDILAIINGEPVLEHRSNLARQTAELLIGRLGE